MPRIEKTVFISYRRADLALALLVFKELTLRGYDVFIDYDGIASGDFKSVILENIRARAHFLILLTPTALDRCAEPGDWLRREIEAAIQARRNIVPLLLPGFDFASPAVIDKLTGRLATLGKYNGLPVHLPYFDEAIERLCQKHLAVPLESVLQPASPVAVQAAKAQQAAAESAPEPLLKDALPAAPTTSRAGTPLLVAAVSLTAGLVILAAMIWKADFLVRLGLVGYLWYVLLLLVGLAAAVCLFALFKSYASYSGKTMNGTLELGGPGVLMLVVVGLGFWAVPAPLARFDQTVFVNGESGRLVLRNRGKVRLDFGADRRREAIGDKGEARFIGIPADQRGKKVSVALEEVEDYELVDADTKISLGTEVSYLAVRSKILHLSGQVFDASGKPLAGARLSLPHGTVTTNIDGRFDLPLPADLPEQDRTATITATGFAPWRGQVVPGGSPLAVQLQPAR